MPEGPEAHHCAKILHKSLKGKTLSKITFEDEKDFGITDFESLNLPRRVEEIVAIGKRVIWVLDDDSRIIVSFAMTGGFCFKPVDYTRIKFHLHDTLSVEKDEKSIPVPMVNYDAKVPAADCDVPMPMVDTDDKVPIADCNIKIGKVPAPDCGKVPVEIGKVPATKVLYYRDTRKFSSIQVIKTKKMFIKWRNEHLGYDPLSDEKLDDDEWKALFHRRAIVANILNDQPTISGIGNYLRSEILYSAKISPFRKGNTLTDDELKRLHRKTIKIMKKSLSLGGHTIESFEDPHGNVGKYEPKIYGCKIVTNDEYLRPVSMKLCKNQNVYWAPSCQKDE